MAREKKSLNRLFQEDRMTTISEFETEVWRTANVRVVLRTVPGYEIFSTTSLAAALNKVRLKWHDLTVSSMRKLISDNLLFGERGKDMKKGLKPSEIVFISPNGIRVNGNVLLKNITM